MTHLHKSSGLYFEVGELMEFPVKDARKTYDMSVITLWGCADGEPDAPIIIGYYFGEYDAAITDHYINEWFAKQAIEGEWLKIVRDCKDIVDAYWVTNEDVLTDDDFGINRKKVQRTLTNLNRILEVMNNEK